MEKLDSKYVDRLEKIAEEVQSSELLEQYLDDEEESSYRALTDEFEPAIEQLYQDVADNDPMQLLDLEDKLLDERLESLYMPRVLGFTVLRGVVNENFKYINPQDSFRKVLLYICSSPNFDIVKNRIGQTVQIGFALSSDIWISNILSTIELKRVRQYLEAQKLDKYRDLENRREGYLRYKNQFSDLNFYTARFPKDAAELKVYYHRLKDFIVERVLREKDNTSLHSYVVEFVKNDKLPGSIQYVYLFGLFINYFDLEGDDRKEIAKRLNKERKEITGFNEKYFTFLKELLSSRVPVTAECDRRVSDILDKKTEDDLSMYYNLTDIIHNKGYIHEDTQQAVRDFYYAHEGLSTINECLRLTILKYFHTLLSELEEEDYREFMEIYNTFIAYMNIFKNEKFDLTVKHLSMDYIRRLTKHYTEKRGKDYQDIKKFTMTTFQDLGFMNEKELKNFFKTKRKRKKKQD